MKKERFKEIISNYSSSSDDVRSLKKLASDYPFSQIIHLLLANASKINDAPDYKPNLGNAAFHSTDRTVLKSLIENNLVPSELLITKSISKGKKVSKAVLNKSTPSKTKHKHSNIPSDDLVAEVLENLEKLQKIKQETAIWFEEKPTTKIKKKSPAPVKTSSKTKKEEKSSKGKSQIKIIEKFIEEAPSITKNAKPANDKSDMASSSGKMRDDVISESLAKIFVKQGKFEKAIDIYKKLIWKFPQKKALFAAQIEKLKKK